MLCSRPETSDDRYLVLSNGIAEAYHVLRSMYRNDSSLVLVSAQV
jgi:hypothetical protein